jgi:murein L,D-transpeptidase YcbB/YkuD
LAFNIIQSNINKISLVNITQGTGLRLQNFRKELFNLDPAVFEDARAFRPKNIVKFILVILLYFIMGKSGLDRSGLYSKGAVEQILQRIEEEKSREIIRLKKENSFQFMQNAYDLTAHGIKPNRILMNSDNETVAYETEDGWKRNNNSLKLSPFVRDFMAVTNQFGKTTPAQLERLKIYEENRQRQREEERVQRGEEKKRMDELTERLRIEDKIRQSRHEEKMIRLEAEQEAKLRKLQLLQEERNRQYDEETARSEERRKEQDRELNKLL